MSMPATCANSTAATLCPVVRDPQPAIKTLPVTELGGIDVEVDVEFGAEGESPTVIGVQAAL